MSSVVRIGVIGCGSVMSKYMKIAEQLQFRGQARVVAACDLIESRAQHMHDDWGVPRTTTRAQQVIEAEARSEPHVFAYPLSASPYLRGEHLALEEPHLYCDIMDLVDAIQQDRAPRATGEQARHVVEIVETAYRAAETGQAQVLETTFEHRA